MAAGPDRNHLVEPPLPDDESPGMLGKMAGKPDEGPGHGQSMPQPGRPRIEPEGAHRLVFRHFAAGVGGEDGGHFLGQPERLARLAEREPGPEVDYRRGERGAVPAPPLVHVLDHLLPAFVLEVDVDVRRLAPLLRYEAFEQEVVPVRIDCGDPEHVAHRGIGGRPSSLGEDPPRPRKANEVVYGEKIGRVAEPVDDRELALDLDLHRGGDPGAVALVRPLAYRLLQPDHGGTPIRVDFVRIAQAQLIEREADPAGDVQGRLDCLRTVPEEPGHLGRRFEPALGILEEIETHLVDAPPGAKTGEHVGDGTPVRPVHEDRVGRNERHPGRPGRARRLSFPRIVRRRRQPAAKREPHLPGKGRTQRGQGRGEVRCRTLRRQRDQHHPFRRGEEIAGAQPPVPGSVFGFAPGLDFILALASAPVPIPVPSPCSSLTLGQKPGQPPVGSAVARIGEHGRSVRETEPGPDDRSQTRRTRRHVDPHRAGERVVIRDSERLQTQLRGPPDQLLGMGSASQEGIVRDGLELHVAGGARAGTHPGSGARATGRTRTARHPAHPLPLVWTIIDSWLMSSRCIKGRVSRGQDSRSVRDGAVARHRGGSREYPVQEPARGAGMQIPVEPQACAFLGLDLPVVAPPRRSPFFLRAPPLESDSFGSPGASQANRATVPPAKNGRRLQRVVRSTLHPDRLRRGKQSQWTRIPPAPGGPSRRPQLIRRRPAQSAYLIRFRRESTKARRRRVTFACATWRTKRR